MRDDVKRLLKEFKVTTFGFKGDIKRVQNQIRPDEQLFYIDSANATFRNKQTGEKRFAPGVVFVSNQRVLHAEYPAFSTAPVKEEFELFDIHSICTKGKWLASGNLSFSTSTKRVDFFVTFDKAMLQKIEDTLVQTIAEFGPALYEKSLLVKPEEKAKVVCAQSARVVECPGCSAVNIVMRGMIGRCEYCDRYLQ